MGKIIIFQCPWNMVGRGRGNWNIAFNHSIIIPKSISERGRKGEGCFSKKILFMLETCSDAVEEIMTLLNYGETLEKFLIKNITTSWKHKNKASIIFPWK